MKLQKPQPLYLQLRQLLEEYIHREQPAILPAEAELMTQYGVSRKTVRNAIAELVKTGLVTPMPGKGTIVNRPAAFGNKLVILLDDFAVLPPYLYEIYLAVKAELDRAGIAGSVILINPKEPELAERLTLLLDPQSTVLLFSSAANRNDLFQLLHKRKALSVGYRPQQPFHALYSDLKDGYRQIIQYLLDQGHRCLAVASLQRDAERYQAFRQTIADAGLVPDRMVWVEASGTRLDGYRAAPQILAHPDVTGIVAHNDFTALGIMEYLLQQHFKIPEQFSLGGCDNIADAGHFPIPLTTIGHDLAAYCRQVTDFLQQPRPVHRLARPLPMQLMIRQSIISPGRK